MKKIAILLTIILLAGATAARAQDTTVIKVKWTRNIIFFLIFHDGHFYI
jgi:hypothetical protein